MRCQEELAVVIQDLASLPGALPATANLGQKIREAQEADALAARLLASSS